MININFLEISLKACEEIAVLRIILFIKEILKIVTFIIPILLIVMVSLDIAKNVIANKEDEMKKNMQIATKRIIYAVVVFLIPSIVSLVIEGVGQFDTEYKDCLLVTKESIEEQKEVNEDKCIRAGNTWDEATFQCMIKATPPNSSSNNNSTTITNTSQTQAGDLIYYNQGEYKNVAFCGSGKSISSSGCGATSLSIMASTFSNKKFDPKYMGNWLCSNGHSGGALPASYFTSSKVLNHFGLSVTKLFHKTDKHKGNAGKTYSQTEGTAILKAVEAGQGIVLYVPGHYLAVGPNHKCVNGEVYLYDVGKRAYNGCYTPKELFQKTYNYKNRCSDNGNCGWKAAWAYTSK